jgi:hypothetical protein
MGRSETLSIGETSITIDHADRLVTTAFPDGTNVPARLEDTNEYRAMAARLGYEGDLWRLCWQHEAFHTWVPVMMGHPHSLVLWNVAHGNPKRWPEGGREEEGYVTSWQRYMQTGESDDLVLGIVARATPLTLANLKLGADLLLERLGP